MEAIGPCISGVLVAGKQSIRVSAASISSDRISHCSKLGLIATESGPSAGLPRRWALCSVKVWWVPPPARLNGIYLGNIGCSERACHKSTRERERGRRAMGRLVDAC
jgi:hypothetical protein